MRVVIRCAYEAHRGKLMPGRYQGHDKGGTSRSGDRTPHTTNCGSSGKSGTAKRTVSSVNSGLAPSAGSRR
jgi:hypothetical protein